MTTQAERDEIFHQSVVDIIMRFTPEKKNIVVPPETIKELKDIVRAKVLCAPQAFIDAAAARELQYPPIPLHMSRRSSNDSADDDESSRMSSEPEDKPEERKDPDRTVAIRREEMCAIIKGDTYRFLELQKEAASFSGKFRASHKKMSRAQRVQELRNHRRKKATHTKFERIECTHMKEFPDYFFDWYTEQIAKGGDLIYLHHLIINTVHDYFERHTFAINVDRMVIDFLRRDGILGYGKLISMYENTSRGDLDSEKQILEMQLMVLLDLYCIALQIKTEPQYNTQDPDWYKPEFSDILQKLRYLYTAGNSSELKAFLDDVVSDNFNHIMPKEIAKIYEMLCIEMPADLEEFDPSPHIWNNPDDFLLPARHLKVSSETSKKLQAMLEEGSVSSDTSSTSRDSKSRNGKAAKKERASDEPGPSTQADEVPTTPKRVRQTVIPETPEEKLLVKEEHYDEVVKQTPMGKLRQGSKRGNRKLAELVKLSEERTRPSRAAALASEKANKAIMSAGIASNVTKETLFALHTPSPTSRPQRSARTNLIDRFMATPSSATSSGSTSPNKRKRVQESSEEPERKRTRTSQTRSTPPGSVSPNSKGGIPGLGKEQIQQYKKRMSEITKQKSPSSGAQTRARTSLFEDAAEQASPSTSSASPSKTEAVQKNRTGREVRSSTMVHIAHILFNVHNPAPLMAFNPAKMKHLAGTRLQRLVRIAKKSQKVRLQRLRNRVRQSQAAEAAALAPPAEPAV